MKYIIQICLVISGLLMSQTSSQASSVTGLIKQMIVGRLGHQVWVDIDVSAPDYPCSPPNSNGFDYYFSLNEAGADQKLSALLIAYASNRKILIVGTGTCDSNTNLEQMNYPWLRSE